MSAPDAPRRPVHTGGCQCGAIRFALYAEPRRIGICHCRMCQKAVAGPFAVLAEVACQRVRLDARPSRRPFDPPRAPRAISARPAARRSAIARSAANTIELLTGAFDAPASVTPTYATGTESRLAWLDAVNQLPGRTTHAVMGAEKLAAIQSFQHPDAPGDERG